MGLLSNYVKESELEEGDHVYVYRKFYTYAHHGIYVGGKKVVHFGADDEVVMTCLNCFKDKGSLHRFEYGVSIVTRFMKRPGTCSTGKSDPPQTVKARALYWLHKYKGFGNYNLLLKNCEGFATHCKTGLFAGMQTIYSGQSGALPFLLWTPILGLFRRGQPRLVDAPDFATDDTLSAAELQAIPCASCRRST